MRFLSVSGLATALPFRVVPQYQVKPKKPSVLLAPSGRSRGERKARLVRMQRQSILSEAFVQDPEHGVTGTMLYFVAR